ncbi:MAG: hypothetical protein AAFR58_10025 [Cyanobacteria bacterium J06627_28]
MLTSHHYLLGGLMAIACATGATMHTAAGVASDLPQGFSQGSFSQGPIETSSSEAVDVSYRGSGRASDSPDQNKKATETYRERFLISHRGSGRVTPSHL